MKIIIHAVTCILLFSFCFAHTGRSQSLHDSINKTQQQYRPGNDLFESDEILSISLQGDINALLKDRSDNSSYHPVLLTIENADGQQISISAKLKTRGHFRKLKENCYYPPLTINFPENDLQNTTIFKGQNKLKLVMPCRGDQYIINEWLVYKLYNLITAKSFKARLASVTLKNEDNKIIKKPFYAFILEDEDQMARRNQMISLERKLQPQQTNTEAFLVMAVFEYLIANTDWSTQYLQNIKMIASNSNAVPFAIPYDFDHAGIVDAPYAQPFEALKMRSIKERRYRGYCVTDLSMFIPVIELYNQLKNDIYGLYNNCSLMDERQKKRTIRFLDEFYDTINNTKDWQYDFSYPCNKNGTGNVVIKGLQK